MTKTITINKTKELLNQVDLAIDELKQSEKFQNYLRLIANFNGFSFKNTLLINRQYPNATMVKGFNQWKKEGVSVKKDSKAIRIFAPAFRKYKETNVETNETLEIEELAYFVNVPVFDISQTNSEKNPTTCKELTQNVENVETILYAIESATSATVHYHEDNTFENGSYNRVTNVIRVKKYLSNAQKIKTLIHEVAHSLLHDDACDLDNQTREFEAESVAYVVCSYLNIDSSDYSIGYLLGYTFDKNKKELIEKTLKRIHNTSNAIIKKIA